LNRYGYSIKAMLADTFPEMYPNSKFHISFLMFTSK